MRVPAIILLGAALQSASGDEQPWPTHTICSTSKLQAYYRSCDPLQDVGLSISPCSVEMTGKINSRVLLILRQSVEELYLSADVYYNGYFFHHYDITLCEPEFPRFMFCGYKRGELITQENPVSINLEVIPKGHLNMKGILVNQNGFQIACINATIIRT
ncbi:lymphocyte antigen 86 [Megalops cyprinoides]|uniref:lymphocyte antigen 86 n=1 Tax=Megalops cyprinoides TaxID=118141 RepID=UPI001865676B|nr:lymphocyte antigen 86 [Megalops cyprinoides]